MEQGSWTGLHGQDLVDHIEGMFRNKRLVYDTQARCVFLVLQDFGKPTERKIPVFGEGYVNGGDMFDAEVTGVISTVAGTRSREVF